MSGRELLPAGELLAECGGEPAGHFESRLALATLQQVEILAADAGAGGQFSSGEGRRRAEFAEAAGKGVRML